MIQIPAFKSVNDDIREHYSKELGVPVERISVRYDPDSGVTHVIVAPEVKAHFIQFDVTTDLT